MKYLIVPILLLTANLSFAQSTTTQELHKKYEDAFYLYFYENTLKMINQGDNPEFSKLIDGIEKMKFLRIDKEKYNFSSEDVRELMSKYKEDAFEELMSMRDEGSDIKIYIKEKEKVTLGLVMLINEQASLSVLDIKGSVPLDELASLYDKVKSIN